MTNNKRATVFCASSPRIPQCYFDDAAELAELLVRQGYDIVYGGGSVGLMGCVADKALSIGGTVIGVIPRFMVDVEWQHKGVADMRLTETMAERKKMLIELADVIIVLPGSTGTLDELFDSASQKKLGLIGVPIVVLNTNHFYDNMQLQLRRMVDEGFMTDKHLQTIYFASTPGEVIEFLQVAKNVMSDLKDAAVH